MLFCQSPVIRFKKKLLFVLLNTSEMRSEIEFSRAQKNKQENMSQTNPTKTLPNINK